MCMYLQCKFYMQVNDLKNWYWETSGNIVNNCDTLFCKTRHMFMDRHFILNTRYCPREVYL